MNSKSCGVVPAKSVTQHPGSVIFARSFYDDRLKFIRFMMRDTSPFNLLLYSNQYLKNKHREFTTLGLEKGNVLEMWEEVVKLVNLLEDVCTIKYSSEKAQHKLIHEAVQWLKPFLNVLLIYSCQEQLLDLKVQKPSDEDPDDTK